MISCDSFRTRFHAGTDDAALLEHLRTCDRCLDFAAHDRSGRDVPRPRRRARWFRRAASTRSSTT